MIWAPELRNHQQLGKMKVAESPFTQFFRCAGISWIHVGKWVSYSCFWDFVKSWACRQQHIWGYLQAIFRLSSGSHQDLFKLSSGPLQAIFRLSSGISSAISSGIFWAYVQAYLHACLQAYLQAYLRAYLRAYLQAYLRHILIVVKIVVIASPSTSCVSIFGIFEKKGIYWVVQY